MSSAPSVGRSVVFDMTISSTLVMGEVLAVLWSSLTSFCDRRYDHQLSAR
jgi:hypothetical protein